MTLNSAALDGKLRDRSPKQVCFNQSVCSIDFFCIRLPSGLLPVLGPLEAVHDSYT